MTKTVTDQVSSTLRAIEAGYGLAKSDYRDAIWAQDACNLSGVVLSWGAVLSRMTRAGAGTDAKNEHPISILYACKVADMTGLGISQLHRYSLAHEACKGALERADIPDRPAAAEEKS